MAVIVVISFFFSRKNKFGQKESQFLSRILLYVINPCMIVSTFDVDFDREKLKFLALAIGVSFAFHLVMIIMATVLFARKKSLQEQSASNSGFIGIPLINGVFGGEGVFYLMGYILVFNILLWFWGEWIVTGAMRPLKILANPNVIACAAGLVVFCVPFRMPYAVIEPLRMIGSCNGAVSMMLLGLLFASFGGDKSLTGQGAADDRLQEQKAAATIRAYARPLARDVALRLLACPLILLFATLFALRAFDFVHEIKLIMSVLFIAAACPVGMSVSSFAVVFKKDADYASLLVAVSSAACIVTIPLLVALLEALV